MTTGKEKGFFKEIPEKVHKTGYFHESYSKGKQNPDFRFFIEILQGLKGETLKSGLFFFKETNLEEDCKPLKKVPLHNGWGTFVLLIRL